MIQFYVQYYSESEGGWQGLSQRSSLGAAIERAMMHEKAGESGSGDYSQTRVFIFHPDSCVMELSRHQIIKRKEVVQYNKKGSSKGPKVSVDWNSQAYVQTILQSVQGSNAG